MKIAFFGTPDFAVPVLESLINSHHEVILAVSQPDRPKGRDMQIDQTPVKKIALKSGITVLQPVKCTDPAFISEYKKLTPDINIIVAFGQILPDEIIYHPKFASVNIHASLLPKYRGASPINWAVINGDKETGITYQFIEKRLDAGDIINVERIAIEESDDAVSMFLKLSELSGDTVVKVVNMIAAGKTQRIKQDESKATTVKTLKKEEGRLDFNLPAKSIVNKIRGLVPWPCAYCSLKGRSLKILSASTGQCPPGSESSAPGTITGFAKGLGFYIKAADTCVIAKTVQPDSGKKMSGTDFANGQKDLVGLRLE
jgi:methionyl-tRNA formyltransferase